MRLGAASALALLCVLLLGACARQPLYPPADAGPLQGGDSGYLIGPGDMLNVVVWRNPELSMSIPVRPDGKITTPLVEDLPAAGKNSTDLARDIEKRLSASSSKVR
jgi:polysaccharide export outer membrane protein